MVVAGATRAKVNRQQLELAELVASQGVQKDPKYAPLHNTAGLIKVELQDYNSAVKSFGRARTLDPNFFIETGGLRPHQIRLEGGDASSDSYCYA